MFCIEEGTPTDRPSLPASIQSYSTVLGDLSIVDDVICMGERIVIPLSLRPTCLEALHAAHQGISGMTAHANSSIYWPGITPNIKAMRERCPTCNSNAPSQPPMPSITPIQSEYPFQHICADFFHHEGSTYLVLVDRYSGWPVVSPASNGAKGLAATLIDTFSTFGIPTTLTSDGGPEFSSQTTLNQLGCHAPGLFSILPPRQQQGGNRSENHKETHCRKHWPRWIPAVILPQSPPAVQEQPQP